MEEQVTHNDENNGLGSGRPLLRADTVYLYMGSEARVSRSTRAQWLIEHLDAVVTIPSIESLDKIDKMIEIVSVIPEEQGLVEWKPDNSHLFQYYIHPGTQLLFLSRRYCLVYCLDMSPSLSTVDIQNGEVMTDKVLTCLKTSLEGVSKSFVLPGSNLVFHPEIYVTIIANTPFFTTPAQQVLVQGWRVTSDNLFDLFRNIQAELLKIENALVEVYELYVDQLEAHRMEFDKIVGGLFEEGEETTTQKNNIAMVNPDQGFINMLRFGMLALRLLPASSCGSIIVITDGVITLPDAHLLEATLNRFRTTGVCCSFLHVGSPYHPHGAQARVPYTDLMQFVANASLGVHMTNIPETTILDFRDLQMNMYHKAFLSWSFQTFDKIHIDSSVQSSQWDVHNPSFCAGQDLQLLRKKQLEDTLNVPLVKILCCRIREGYTIKNIHLSESQIKIKLLLGWKYQVNLEYNIRSMWPPSCHSIHYSLFIKAPYDFLHDITCINKKPFQSPFRQAVVNRFWNTLKTLTQSDYLLVHLHAQENNSSWCAIPESVRSGMPLFNIQSTIGMTSPMVTTSDVSNPQFAQFWKPVSLLDPDAWHKWLHTHRIGLILRHDSPLPKNIHLTNPSGRFQIIQCRQAATTLQSYLRNISTFVLVENQSFVKIYPSDENQGSWFYIIRITSKAPCIVLNIAFPCGISSQTRLKIVLNLKTQLSELSCHSGLSPKERRILDKDFSTKEHPPVFRTSSKVKCCLVLQKPVEKILIRYERMPNRFDTVVFPDGTQPLISSKPVVPESGKTGYLVTTLSRYLHHKRWIWAAQCGSGASFGNPNIARILSTITKIRLQEGFSFSHSHAGIVNMLLEVQMHGNPDLGEEVSRCVIQYVIFPPNCTNDENNMALDGESDEDESEGLCQIVTESWVEPHCGFVSGGPPRRMYMDQLPYNKVSDAIAEVDAHCISALLTFEELSLMSRNKTALQPPMMDITQFKDKVFVRNNDVSIKDERIHSVPFLFNLFLILPNCRQAELLFSMPVQDLSNWQVTSKLVENKEVSPDAKNISLMELIFDQLGKLHDRELQLSSEDSRAFVSHLHKRERGANVPPVPIPELGNTEEQTPGWKCYVKSINEDHITMTFIPASYMDLKSMMVTTLEDTKPLKSLTLDDNNISEYLAWNRREHSSGSIDQVLNLPEPVRCRSISEDKKMSVDNHRIQPTINDKNLKTDSSPIEGNPRVTQSSLDSLILPEQPTPNAVFGTPTSGSSQPTLESSDSSLHRVFNAMTKPFRVRASSLDTNLGRTPRRNHTVPSLRTTSMEAKIWGNRSIEPSGAVSETSGVTRSNTQASEYSVEQIDKSSNLDTNSEDIMPSGDMREVQDSNKVFTTIPLPIFIYDCPLNHLIDTIIYKSNKQ